MRQAIISKYSPALQVWFGWDCSWTKHIVYYRGIHLLPVHLTVWLLITLRRLEYFSKDFLFNFSMLTGFDFTTYLTVKFKTT